METSGTDQSRYTLRMNKVIGTRKQIALYISNVQSYIMTTVVHIMISLYLPDTVWRKTNCSCQVQFYSVRLPDVWLLYIVKQRCNLCYNGVCIIVVVSIKPYEASISFLDMHVSTLKVSSVGLC